MVRIVAKISKFEKAVILSKNKMILSFPKKNGAHRKYVYIIGVKFQITLKCLSIGTPKTINFSFVSNGKLMLFRCRNIQAHYNEAIIYLNFGTPKNNEFSIWNKWKIYYLGVPILKHIRVIAQKL